MIDPKHSPIDEEILPVVDEQDALIDRLPRGEVHRRALRHRAAHVAVFDRRGFIWLQRRSFDKDTWPGAWDLSATGHVQPDETYAETARRELNEELRIDGRPVYLTMLPASERTGWEFQALFGLHYEGRIRDFDRSEIIRMRRFPVDTIENLLDGADPRFQLTPAVDQALPHVIDYIQQTVDPPDLRSRR